MADKTPCFTLVADEGDLGYQTQDLRAALEKGTDDLKLDTLRRIIVSTLNGQPHVRPHASRCSTESSFSSAGDAYAGSKPPRH